MVVPPRGPSLTSIRHGCCGARQCGRCFSLAILFACMLSGSATWGASPSAVSSSAPPAPFAASNAAALDDSRNSTSSGEVLGFWHIGAANKGLGPKNRGVVVLQQLEELKKLPIFGKVKIQFLNDPDVLDAELLTTLSSQPNFVPLAIPSRFHKLHQAGEKLYEYPTLSAFWSHCHANPQDIVFYMHTKTRHGKRNWYQDNMFHNIAMVIRLLRGGKWIYTPTRCESMPFCHAPGNFFWARCDHVVRLNDPFDESFLREDGSYFDNPPRGRYMAEYWLVSDFLGPRKVRESVLHPGQRFRPSWSRGSCENEKHGNLCRHIAVAQKLTGVSWEDWAGKKARPKMVPFDGPHR